MILFYFSTNSAVYQLEIEFQFHYDLILFITTDTSNLKMYRFQFHYDLILL